MSVTVKVDCDICGQVSTLLPGDLWVVDLGALHPSLDPTFGNPDRVDAVADALFYCPHCQHTAHIPVCRAVDVATLVGALATYSPVRPVWGNT